MAKPILTTFTDAEYARLDRVLADVQNTVEDNEVSTPSDLIRRAVVAYVDFYEKLAAGGLDHNPAVDLVLESVDGLRDITPPRGVWLNNRSRSNTGQSKISSAAAAGERRSTMKLAASVGKRYNARLFCVMHRLGKAAEWTPYRGRHAGVMQECQVAVGNEFGQNAR